MWICDQRRYALRGTRAANHAHPLHDTTLSLRSRREPLKPLIQHPLDRALRHAQIARAQALVEALNALLPQNLLDHTNGASEERPRPRNLGLMRVELETCLNDPDGVCHGTGGDAGERGGGEMYP